MYIHPGAELVLYRVGLALSAKANTYKYTHINTSIHTHICIHIYIYICIFVYIYILTGTELGLYRVGHALSEKAAMLINDAELRATTLLQEARVAADALRHNGLVSPLPLFSSFATCVRCG